MNSNDCPLSHFVPGMPRLVTRGYGCRATGGRCKPSDICSDWIKEQLDADKLDAQIAQARDDAIFALKDKPHG